MDNLEKVIRGLECCARFADSMEFFSEVCGNCPYNDNMFSGTCSTIKPLLTDALALLREQEPQMVHAMQRHGGITYFCPRCRNPVEYFYAGEFNHYCAFCGQAINFETIHWMTPPARWNEVSEDG